MSKKKNKSKDCNIFIGDIVKPNGRFPDIPKSDTEYFVVNVNEVCGEICIWIAERKTGKKIPDCKSIDGFDLVRKYDGSYEVKVH